MTIQTFKNKNTIFLFFGIWEHLSKKRRIQLFALFFVSVFSAFSEIVSLTAVIPFLAILTSSDSSLNLPRIPLGFLNFKNISEINLINITIIFILTVLLASLIKLLNLWLNGRIAAAIGSDISCKSFKRSISQPYLVHLNRNSSSLITTLISEVNLTVVAINLFLKLLTALILSLGILFKLSLINFDLAISSVFIFSIIYFSWIFIKKNPINNSRVIFINKEIS